MSVELSNLLFPEINETPNDIINKTPKRPDWKMVTRISPSPTWFMHIWWVYTAFINERLSHQAWWTFFLRIEDTDQAREKEWAFESILNSFKIFDIPVDEGPIWPNYSEVWEFWPYIQSQREYIYKVFAKDLIIKWLAYPCFMSNEELESIRQSQEKAKQIPGIYWEFAKWRNKSIEDIKSKLDEWTNYVVRLLSPWHQWNKIKFNDLLRWEIETQEYFNDVILLKSDGIPTYHFAHVVDDFLMWTTHVLRWDEWIASVPLHLQLFQILWLKAPQYWHIAPLVKIEWNSKRKLSKRKDPEANAMYYIENWFPAEAVLEYLSNIINASYEDWQKANPWKIYKDFTFNLEHMWVSWALLDLAKLEFVSTEYIASLDINTFYEKALSWMSTYNKSLYEYMKKYPDYTKAAMNIERWTPNDPKRFHKFSDIEPQLVFFYDEEFIKIWENKPEYPENITPLVRKSFLKEYMDNYSLDQNKEEWFEQLKLIANKNWFALNNAQFKEWGYVWKVWDVAMLLRIVLCWSKTTPDLYETMQVLGTERINQRIQMSLEE